MVKVFSGEPEYIRKKYFPFLDPNENKLQTIVMPVLTIYAGQTFPL